MTSFTPRKPRSASERRKAVQNGSASEGPVVTPSTSRRPSVLTPMAIINYRRNRDDPARVARFQVRRVDPQVGPGPLDGPGEERVHPLVNLCAQPALR